MSPTPTSDYERARLDDALTQRYRAQKRELARLLKARQLPREEWERRRLALDVAEEEERRQLGLPPRRESLLRREGLLE
ncbi:MAG: hypothetical protein EXR60_03905 [Dehalococcoidia bacterium]|nr:hypothetical protein [Dehalococcoidia bacterium]